MGMISDAVGRWGFKKGIPKLIALKSFKTKTKGYVFTDLLIILK